MSARGDHFGISENVLSGFELDATDRHKIFEKNFLVFLYF